MKNNHESPQIQSSTSSLYCRNARHRNAGFHLSFASSILLPPCLFPWMKRQSWVGAWMTKWNAYSYHLQLQHDHGAVRSQQPGVWKNNANANVGWHGACSNAADMGSHSLPKNVRRHISPTQLLRVHIMKINMVMLSTLIYHVFHFIRF